MKCPCKDCPDRSITCHAECPAYAEWSEARKQINAQRLRESSILNVNSRGKERVTTRASTREAQLHTHYK